MFGRMGLGLGLGGFRGYIAPVEAGVQPVLLLDFENGVYELDGVSKTLAEVLTEDLGWGTYDPAHVVADVGLQPPASGDTSPVLTTLAAADLIAGCVAVISYTMTDPLEEGLNGVAVVRFDQPGFLTYQEGLLDIREDEGPPAQARAGIITTILPAAVFVNQAAAYKAAFNFDNTQVGASINGAGPAVGPADAPEPPTHIGLYASIGANGAVTVTKMEFYSQADYDNADLATLSTL